jgi:hypothetical protein
MVLLLTLLVSFSAFAQEKCGAWPSVTAHGGPRLAATGMPFTNFLRFSCALGDEYLASAVEGEYRFRAERIGAIAITTHTLPSGEILYQALFSVSNRAVAGVYTFEGCARIREKKSGASVCLKLPTRSLEIVRTE